VSAIPSSTFHDLFGGLSGALTLLCVFPYLRDVSRGVTVPQRMSWFIFAMLSISATVAQAAAGADSGVLLAGGAAIGFSAVFVTSIKRGVGGASRWDFVALGIGLAGLVLWHLSNRPMVAIAAIGAAEVAAVALTVAKSLKAPGSETLSTWVVDAVAGVMATIGVGTVDAAHLLYPVHHVILNGAVVAAIFAGRKFEQRLPSLNNENIGIGRLAASQRAKADTTVT
jgi:hypothetical protein